MRLRNLNLILFCPAWPVTSESHPGLFVKGLKLTSGPIVKATASQDVWYRRLMTDMRHVDGGGAGHRTWSADR